MKNGRRREEGMIERIVKMDHLEVSNPSRVLQIEDGEVIIKRVYNTSIY